ncbi:YbaB/EbfC family nucleoid-associated protein [Amycolatopsis sp. CA-230715]|uniref:YbaB/EbfC family nucleoid-associated protein n=1 Tax=Amycolatopsis sp. CA-230715 TaxID=2745196 RepID=UPI001C0385DC|nr:YbaB/EbfC family nucleoid-associated protein [Amycolatopsis sp. CA-230715]QWF84344.1 hypothetical protein HUW46_07794 [Amycolatopsis sp. CA-230715]
MTDGVPAQSDPKSADPKQPGQERLAAVQQDLLRAIERTQQEGREASAASAALARVSGRASSKDNAVTVVVDSNGVPKDIAFTDKIGSRTPHQLAAELMGCLQRAQATLAREFAQQAGDNPFAAKIAQGYENRFPEPESDAVPAPVHEMQVGQLSEPESAPAPPPAPRKVPKRQREKDEEYEEDFGQTGFLLGPDGKRGPNHG